MIDHNKENHPWLKITLLKKREDAPSEIRIDKDGKVFIDGELYEEENSKYKNLIVNVEKHNKVNTGEETQRMIDSQKEAEKGKTITVTETREPNKSEITTVKY